MPDQKSIDEIPNELILMFSGYLPAADLYSLILTSRRFSLLIPPLLHTVASELYNINAAFYWAVLTGNRAFAKYLIENGVQVQQYLTNVPKDEDEHLDRVMDQGVDVCVRDNFVTEPTDKPSYPDTHQAAFRYSQPLYYAIKTKRHALLRLVLENVSTKSSYSIHILKEATLHGTPEVVKTILAHTKATFGKDIFKSALNKGLSVVLRNSDLLKASLEIWLQLFLSLGADVNYKLETEQESIFSGYCSMDNESEHSLNKLRYMDDYNDASCSIIHLAVSYASTSIVKWLIDNGTNLNATDSEGLTPFHIAAIQNKLETCRLLLDNGVDINHKSNNGQTPLQMVIETRNLEMTQFLLENGADANHLDNNGNSALHLVSSVNTCHRHSKSWAFYSNPPGDVRLLKLLLENGADVNARNKQGETALHLAVRMLGDPQDICILLMFDGCGFPEWRMALIDLLTESGADTKAVDSRGYMPVLTPTENDALLESQKNVLDFSNSFFT